MKKHALLTALAVVVSAANAYSADMDDKVLTQRQLNLAVCACLEAQGDMVLLDAALRRALDEGVGVNELKEAFSQLYAYTGFPRSLNALNLLKSVLEERRAEAMGNTPEQVEYLCRYLSEHGLSQSDNAADACAGAWPQGAPNTAYSDYFVGNSYLAPIVPKNLADGPQSVQPYSNVTFEPGCRNNWHIHRGGHQILICVSGRGWYQEWGKPAVALNPGDVIDIPEGVKHWHGAQRDSWFQHLATHVATGGEQRTEWLEPVGEEQYNQAK